jgi:hypothetical protein
VKRFASFRQGVRRDRREGVEEDEGEEEGIDEEGIVTTTVKSAKDKRKGGVRVINGIK